MGSQVLFGRRIRSIREAAGLTRETVAEKAKISVNYLGEIERGEKWPKPSMIERISDAIGVSPAALFEYEAEELDDRALTLKIQQLLATKTTKQLQEALRVLRALFQQ